MQIDGETLIMDSSVQMDSNRSNLPTDVWTTPPTEIVQAYGHWVQEHVLCIERSLLCTGKWLRGS